MALIHDDEFLKLEKDFPFLGRARKLYGQPIGGLDDMTFVIVDIETTGLDPATSEILEIGAIRSRAGQAVDVFHSMVRPTQIIPPVITSITGITAEMVAQAPLAPEVMEKFSQFIQGSVLVAHNTDFDINFLNHHMKASIDRKLGVPALCTVKLSRALLTGLENYKLHTVAKSLNIATPNRHRAMGDAEITLKIWGQLLGRLKIQGKKNLQDISTFLEQAVAQTRANEVPF